MLKPEAAVFPKTQHLAGRADRQVAERGGMQAPWRAALPVEVPGEGMLAYLFASGDSSPCPPCPRSRGESRGGWGHCRPFCPYMWLFPWLPSVPRTERVLQQEQAMAGFPLVLLRKVRRWSKCLSRLSCRGVRLSQPSRQRLPHLDFFCFIAQHYLKVSGVAARAMFALPCSTCLPAGRFPPISLLLLGGDSGLGGTWEPSGWGEPPQGCKSASSLPAPGE